MATIRKATAWVFVLGLGAGGPALSGQAEPRPPRPNFVVVVVDDLGWADLGCYGSTDHATPQLDRLAARGIRFTNGYASCPVCSPTRAALMTGRSPARLHLTDWLPGRADRPDQRLLRPTIRQQLPLEETTLAEMLHAAGYATGSLGKWHLGPSGFWPEQQGFDLNVGGTQAGSPPGGYFGFKTPSLQARGPDEYLTERLSREAVTFIHEHRDRPFFLYLAHYAVHIPLQARPEATLRFESATARGSQFNPIYSAMLESVDEGIGQIVAAIDENGLTDRTVIVFTSDNGGLSVREGPNTPATSNTPLREGKGYLYEGGIRVPWIWVWPGTFAAGRTCDTPIVSTDLLPTIANLIDMPLTPERPLDGVAITPLLRGQGSLPDRRLYWHYPHYSNQGGRPGGAIRSGNWKFIEPYEDRRAELYNLAEDPGESRDRAVEQPALVAEFQADLERWRRSVDAQMPTENPDFQATERKAER